MSVPHKMQVGLSVACCCLRTVCAMLCCALQGYEYKFFAPQPDSAPIMIAASSTLPADPVLATGDVPNNQWTLLVAPRQGWVPSWRNPMLATVIILSVLFGGLVMATLISRHLQLWLLKETKVGLCQECSQSGESVPST